MIDYDVRRSQKRCSVTDRVFEAGEKYLSALVETEDGYERIDFASDQWQGPPDACIGWWHCRVPETSKGRVYWAPNDVLLAYFEDLYEKQNHPLTLFVMGIVLARRKILKMGQNEKDEYNQPLMVLESADKSKSYKIPMMDPDPGKVTSIQQSLAEQLFTDQPPDS